MRKFNLSLDDYSPREGTDDLRWCQELVRRYPEIKIDLFVPAAFARLNDKVPYHLCEYPKFLKYVEGLSRENYRICLHGMYHRRKTDALIHHKRPDSNNDEWEFMNTNEADDRLKMMIGEFDRAGISYEKVFRPPGWRISRLAVEVMIKNGILVAGDKKHYNRYNGKIKNLDKHWVSYNHDLICDVPKGDIISYGHVSKWTNNCLNEDKYNLICNMLDSDEFTYLFIKDMV